MAAEIEGLGFAKRLELQGIENQMFDGSKTRYSRAFLLSCSELDICKQLPPGEFDPLLLLELEDAPREIHQSTSGAGPKFPPNSGASLEKLSPTPAGESNSHKDPHSGYLRAQALAALPYNGAFRQADDLHFLRDAPQCKAGVLDQTAQETGETSSYLLRKSENPYRPPHCHQNAKPYLAAIVESDMGCSPNLPISGTESFRSILDISSELHAVNWETREDDKLISDIQLNELLCIGAPSSDQTGSEEWTKIIDFSNPCALRRAPDALPTELYDMEDSELTFEDVWSEVSAKMRLEQEMDLAWPSEYGQTTDFGNKVSLPRQDSAISIADRSNCAHPGNNYGINGNAVSSDDGICLPDENNCDNGADSDAEICLPDENSLISVDDMIGPWSATDGGARQPVTVDISHHKKRSARQHSTGKPFHGIHSSVAHQEVHFQQSYMQSPWSAGTSAIMAPSHPFGYQQADLTSAQMPLVAPMTSYPYSAVNWYPWTNVHPQPSAVEGDMMVQYSLQQQPTAFPGQDVEMPVNVAPVYPHVAWSNLGYDMTQPHPVPSSD